MLKKGAMLFVFLLFTSLVSASYVHMDLKTDDYGRQQVFDGNLTLELDENEKEGVNALTEVVFSVDGKQTPITLNELFAVLNSGKMPKEFKRFEKELRWIDSQPSYDLQVNAGERNLGPIINLSDAEKVNSISFDVSGSADGVALDWDSDGDVDWKYKGDLIVGKKQLLATPYLRNFASSSTVLLKGDNQKYCEKVILNASSTYSIIAFAKKGEGFDSKVKLIGSIFVGDKPSSTLCNPEDADKPSTMNCCELKPSSSLSQVSCDISLNVEKDTSGFICVNVQLPEEDIEYASQTTFYELAIESANKGTSSAYRGIKSVSKDYLIWGKWNLFNTKLSSKPQNVNIIDKPFKKVYPITILAKGSGSVSFSNLLAEVNYDFGSGKMTDFQIVAEYPERIYFKGPVTFQLSFLDKILTPDKEGDYKIFAKFDGDETSPESFDVIQGPKAVAAPSTYEPSAGELVTFTASGSEPSELGEAIVSYEWNFGDSKKSEGETATHAYLKEGEYNVTLTVKDKLGLTGKARKIITVKPIAEVLPKRLDDVKAVVEALKSRFAASDPKIKESADLLGVTDTLSQASANLTVLKNKMETSTTGQEEIISQLNSIYSAIPTSFDVEAIGFSGKPSTVSDIPSASVLSMDKEKIELFETKLYAAQTDVVLTSEARLIKMTLGAGSETKSRVIIKKTISGTGAVYEIIPSTLTPEFKTPSGAQLVSPGVYSIGSATEIVYTLAGDSLTAATKALTIVVPDNLNDIDITGIPSTELGEEGFYCGDGICFGKEDAKSCSQDCKIKNQWLVPAIVAIVLLLGAIFYIFVYKGPKNFAEVFGSSKSARSLFRSEQDYSAVRDYTRKSLAKGATESQVLAILSKKGWTKKQVMAVLSQVKKELKPKRK